MKKQENKWDTCLYVRSNTAQQRYKQKHIHIMGTEGRRWQVGILPAVNSKWKPFLEKNKKTTPLMLHIGVVLQGHVCRLVGVNSSIVHNTKNKDSSWVARSSLARQKDTREVKMKVTQCSWELVCVCVCAVLLCLRCKKCRSAPIFTSVPYVHSSLEHKLHEELEWISGHCKGSIWHRNSWIWPFIRRVTPEHRFTQTCSEHI